MKKCPECKGKMKEVAVEVEGAKSKAVSYQCSNCDYFEFEPKSSAKIVKEIKAKESPLTIKQKIINLSQNRLGMYFNKDIVRSLKLKPGEDVYVSIPDKDHIVLGLKK